MVGYSQDWADKRNANDPNIGKKQKWLNEQHPICMYTIIIIYIYIYIYVYIVRINKKQYIYIYKPVHYT